MCAVNGPHYERRNKYKTRKNSCCRLFPVTVRASLCFSDGHMVLHLQALKLFLSVDSLNTCRESPLFRKKHRRSLKALMDLFPTT